MIPTSDSNKLGLSPESKKINKRPCRPPPPFKEFLSPREEEDLVLRKYKTYTKAQRLAIIADLKKTLGSRFTKADTSSNELINYLGSLNKLEYNQIIEDLLAIHGPSYLKAKRGKEEWHKCLKQWRRQLKVWIKNIDKPENRGSTRVVSHQNTNEFKQRLIEIISDMTIRSFRILRSKAICALEEIHNRQNPTQKFNKNTFSKHFWYDFKRLHPDVDELYMRLPRIRGGWDKSSKFGETSVADTGDNSDSEDEFNIDFNTLASESKSVSPLIEKPKLVFTLFDEELEENSRESSFLMQNLPENNGLVPIDIISVKKKEEILNFCLSDSTTTDEEEKVPKYDFYKENKMIVETEDNETQRKLFRRFYKNGI